VDDDGRLIVEHRAMGIQPLFVDKLAAEGIQLPPNMFILDDEPVRQRRSFFG